MGTEEVGWVLLIVYTEVLHQILYAILILYKLKVGSSLLEF
jgi:hypothetical protein